MITNDQLSVAFRAYGAAFGVAAAEEFCKTKFGSSDPLLCKDKPGLWLALKRGAEHVVTQAELASMAEDQYGKPIAPLSKATTLDELAPDAYKRFNSTKARSEKVPHVDTETDGGGNV